MAKLSKAEKGVKPQLFSADLHVNLLNLTKNEKDNFLINPY